MDPEHELREAAGQRLREHGPMRPATLLQELERHDTKLLDAVDEQGELDARGLWDLLLTDADPDAFRAYPLTDGRLCDLEHLVDGLTLTHVVTEEERDAGEVAAEPDLTALHLTCADGRTVPRADPAGPLTFTDEDTFAGPAGWLPDAPVLAARIVGGRVEISGLEEVPEVDETTARRLADTRAALLTADPEQPIDEVELLVEARVRYPRLLAEPQAPLRALLAAEGLASDGVDVRDLDAFEDPDDPDDGLADHLYHDHGLAEDEVTAVLRLQGDVLRLSGEVLAASLERLRAAIDGGEDVDAARLTDADRDKVGDALASVDLEAVTVQLAVALGSTDGALAVVEDVMGGDPIAAACLLALLVHAAPDDRDRRARANLAWVRARTLELTADDHAAAERELRRAVEADPDHGPATYDLALYLSDRGQAGAALGLARRVDGPGVEQLIETLGPFTRPGPMSAGRNDPCPCGSGRKHKVCCARRDGWPLSERMPWLMQKLLSFYGSAYASDVVLDVARACRIELGAGELDIAALNLALFEGGLVEDFCDLRGSLLPADELERLRDWAPVRGEVYELVEGDASGTCELLDLRAGERTTIVDHSLARSLGVGDAILAWLVPGDAHPVPFYGAVRIPDRAVSDLLDLLDEQPSATRLGAWLTAMHAPPKLATTTGEELAFVEQVYEVAEPDAAHAALAARLEEDEPGVYQALFDNDGQDTLRGSVTLDGSRLTVTALSVARARWFADLLAEVVPDATLVDEQRLPAGDVVEARELAGEDAGDEDDGLVDLDALPPEVRAQLEQQLADVITQHEDDWVDHPLPALGGATPRQAVDDPTRRNDLLRLLDEMEEQTASWEGPGRAMDVDRLRGLLGLR